MVVEIPGCSFRISGEACDWQIQYEHERKNATNTWEGKYFYPHLDLAVAKAYELALRESKVVATTFKEMQDECKRVKDSLLKAVKKAVSE